MTISFTFVPPLEIAKEITIKLKTETKILECVKIGSKSAVLVFSDTYLKENPKEKKEHLFIEWNANFPNVHKLHVSDTPLAILPLVTIDALETIASFLDVQILILKEPTIGNYYDFFVGFNLPFTVRGPSNVGYKRISVLEPISNDLLASLSAYDEEYTDYIRNATSTFRENILNPTIKTLKDMPESALPNEEVEAISVPIVYEDLLRIMTHTEWLVHIVDNSLNNVEERFRSLSRLAFPLIQRERLRKILSEYVKIIPFEQGMRLEVVNKLPLDTTKFANAINKRMLDVHM